MTISAPKAVLGHTDCKQTMIGASKADLPFASGIRYIPHGEKCFCAVFLTKTSAKTWVEVPQITTNVGEVNSFPINFSSPWTHENADVFLSKVSACTFDQGRIKLVTSRTAAASLHIILSLCPV